MPTLYDLPPPLNTALQRSKQLTAAICAEMQSNELSFARFMQLALYHPEFGYYTTKELTIGEHGDFITAPHISPLFGLCLAKQSQTILQELSGASILEVGAGTGKLAADLVLNLQKLHVLPQHYFIYEISAALRLKQQDYLRANSGDLYDKFIWLAELPKNFKGLIIANEVLDALPTHRFILSNGSPQELGVGFKDGQFVWQILAQSNPELIAEVNILQENIAFAEGYQSEINLVIKQFIPQLVNCLSQGIILCADYGYGQLEYYHPERLQGTLTCFYQHHKHSNPFLYPGLQDITAHVNFTQVIDIASNYSAQLAGYSTQANFLLSCGLLEFAAELEANLTFHEQFKLHQALKTLTLPTEMGERIKFMALSKQFEHELLGFKLGDRRREL